ncbi:MAG: T9SS type A sorting domain-containing protein [Flavobacteriales bacterium]
MKRLLLISILGIPFLAQAQTAKDFAVLIEAEVQQDSSILISWDANASAIGYSLYRKKPSESLWGTPIASPAIGDTQYLDAGIDPKIEYEYKIRRTTNSYSAYGYAHSGVAVSLPADRGNLLLIVTDSINMHLSNEVIRLVEDLNADGWRVVTMVVSATDSPSDVKTEIIDQHDALDGIEMIYLLGHVPVPYSGDINPDAHEDHKGAWPADVYYAEIDGLWKDNSVNNTTSADSRNHNIPNDGKFDNSLLPSAVEIMIGRVDFANMPSFSQDEMTLTKRYLDRTHEFKHAIWTLPKSAIVDDNFGWFSGEAFAASGWRTFSPLVGRANISAADYRTTLNSEGHLFSYGCGGGSYTSAGGIGNTAQLATDSLHTGFTMLFGSYFGDWDRQDNFMRAALAQGRTMSISWSGRPHWFYHSMGMGHPIGYSAKLTQNNASTYQNEVNYGAQWVHVALLGDPSLRMEYLAPPTVLKIDTIDTFDVSLSWQASSENGVSYNVYRRTDAEWIRVNSTPITGTSWIDECVLDAGDYTYMVKAVKLIENYSGSYFNESLGATATIQILADKHPTGNHFGLITVSDQNYVDLRADNLSWTNSVTWILEGQTLHGAIVSTTTESVENTYSVILSNGCDSDTLLGYINIGGIDDNSVHGTSIFPNPIEVSGLVRFKNQPQCDNITVYSIDGSIVKTFPKGTTEFAADFDRGIYLIRASSVDQHFISRLVVQ